MEELKLYTIKEVEGILGVKQRTIYDYIKTQKLKASKIGKYWRVQHKDLQQFINEGTKAQF